MAGVVVASSQAEPIDQYLNEPLLLQLNPKTATTDADKVQLLKILRSIPEMEIVATKCDEGQEGTRKECLEHIRSLSEDNGMNYHISKDLLHIRKSECLEKDVEIVADETQELYIMKTVNKTNEIIHNLTLTGCEFLPRLYYIEFNGEKQKMFMEYFEDAVSLLRLIEMDGFAQVLMKNVYRLQLFARFCIVKIISSLHRMHDNNIVHNDLHGNNILIHVTADKLAIKLIDLGDSFPSYDDSDFKTDCSNGLRAVIHFYKLAKKKMMVNSPEDAEKDILTLPEKVRNIDEIGQLGDKLMTNSEMQLVQKLFPTTLRSMIHQKH